MVEEEWVAAVAAAVEEDLALEAREGIAHLSVPADLVVTTSIPIDQGPTLDLDHPLHAVTVVAQSPMSLDPERLPDVEVDEERATTIMVKIGNDVVVLVMTVIVAAVALALQKGLTGN